MDTKKLVNSKGAAWHPSWYTPDTKHGETASIDGEMPTWEIIQHEDMVVVFESSTKRRRVQMEDGGMGGGTGAAVTLVTACTVVLALSMCVSL
jgi:hypothetical protein